MKKVHPDKHKKVYHEVCKKVDQLMNEMLPSAAIDPIEVQLGACVRPLAGSVAMGPAFIYTVRRVIAFAMESGLRKGKNRLGPEDSFMKHLSFNQPVPALL